MTNTKSKD